MPIPDTDKYTVEIVCKGLCAAGGASATPTLNVFHFRRASSAMAYSPTNIASQFDADILSVIGLALNVDYSCPEVLVRCIDDADEAYTPYTSTVVGAVTGDRTPSFNAATLQLRTNLRGRNYRGSKHFSPMSESQIGDDVWNAGALTVLGNIKSAIQAGFTDSDGNFWQPVVVSQELSQLSVNPTTVVYADVIQIVVNTLVGTMRRRKAA